MYSTSGRKAENQSSKLPLSLCSLSPGNAPRSRAIRLPSALTLRWPRFWELEVSSVEHKVEERRSSEGLPGMNAQLCQWEGLEMTHVSYSSLASLIVGPTKHVCKRLSIGWMNHYSYFIDIFTQHKKRHWENIKWHLVDIPPNLNDHVAWLQLQWVNSKDNTYLFFNFLFICFEDTGCKWAKINPIVWK